MLDRENIVSYFLDPIHDQFSLSFANHSIDLIRVLHYVINHGLQISLRDIFRFEGLGHRFLNTLRILTYSTLSALYILRRWFLALLSLRLINDQIVSIEVFIILEFFFQAFFAEILPRLIILIFLILILFKFIIVFFLEYFEILVILLDFHLKFISILILLIWVVSSRSLTVMSLILITFAQLAIIHTFLLSASR